MKIFTIFGDPVSHSRSPLMHNTVFKTLGINACYTRTHLADGALLKETFFAKKLSGANVTVPHKEAAFNACDEIRGVAKKIGAVNTLIEENGRLIGYNTDAEGFYAAIQSFRPLSNALILGAGGTARALAIVLKDHNITPTILNRSENRLYYFQENNFDCYTWETFTASTYDIIINTTSAGLSDNALPIEESLLMTLLSKSKCAVDVIYGKETPFLSAVKKASLPYKDGSNMLLEQGILANILFANGRYTAQDIEPIMRRSFLL